LLKNYLKKIAIMFFTNNPYRIERFEDMYNDTVGESIDKPETLSVILKCEQGETINYAPPSISNPQETSHRVIGKKPRFKYSGIFKSPNRYLYSISNACIIGQLGLIYDPEKRSFIDESTKEWVINLKQSPYLNVLNLPPKTYLKGTTISFFTIGADGGFYHFLFESITKTGMFRSILNQADHILFNGPSTDWKLKWIDRANIDRSKIIWMDSMAHYDCEQLIFTNRLVADQQLNNWAINTLKETFGIDAAKAKQTRPKKLIWISRKKVYAREVEWENEILALFPDIESVELSHIDADSTIVKLQTATHVIAPHGAGLSNIYLCAPGTKVLELFPNGAFFQPCYSRLSNICKLEHLVMYLDFKDKENAETGLKVFSDVLTKFIC
jgi:hypothetical protein